MPSPRRKGRDQSRRPHLGAASIAGATRAENQDRVMVGVVAGLDTIVVADGLGGLPYGGEAAETAVNYVIGKLRRELPQALEAMMPLEGVRTHLLATAWATAHHLAREANLQNLANADAGFRTTLIVAVALPDHYVVVWLGDGAATIARKDGELVEMLEPHKDRKVPHLLHASLGPDTTGRPWWCTAPREPGDLFAVATDGIGDFYDQRLSTLVRSRVQEHGGDATRAAHAVVEELAQKRDPAGAPLYDDNLTLALLLSPE